MRQFIRNIFFFVGFTITFYGVFLIIFGKYIPARFRSNLIIVNDQSDNFLYNRIENIKNYSNVDILFCGSSHACRGFDTRIFTAYGYRCFNLGSSAQTPVQTEFMLRTYLKILHPKIVVLEVYPLFFESDGFESGIDFMLNMSNIDNQVLSMLNPYKNIKVLNTLLYRKFQREAGITINNKLQTILFSANDKYIDGGFVEKKNAHNIHPKIPFKNHIWLPRENQIQALNDIIVLLKAHHIKLILVQAPVTRLLYKNFENRNEIDKFFLSKGNYYNFNNLLRLNDAVNFFDYSHLNQSGVQMFDRAFIMQCIQKREIKIDTLQCGKMR